HRRLDRAVGRDAAGLRAEDCAAPADLRRAPEARLRAARPAKVIRPALATALFAVAIATGQAFDSARAWEHLRQLVAIGPRPSGSAAIDDTRRYITKQLAAEGLSAREPTWEAQTPIDRARRVTRVATTRGPGKERIAFAGHYATKLYREFRFVGASDGGSSAAFLIELARVLKARRNAFTIELLFLDGEEARLPEGNGLDNTYGSPHYVAAAKADGSLRSPRAPVPV